MQIGRRAVRAFAISSALCVYCPSAAAAQALNSDQHKCLVSFEKSFAKAVGAEAKAVSKCVEGFAKNRLTGSATDCTTGDSRGKVAKAKDKTSKGFAKRCVGSDTSGAVRRPPYGMRVPAVANIAVMTAATSLSARVFGPDLDAALARESLDASVSDCQRAISRDMAKCTRAKLQGFTACTKKGLRDATIVDASGLASCIAADAKGKVARACGGQSRLSNDILTECDGVALGTAFPACGASDTEALYGCIETNIECTTCLALNEAGDLDRDCDVLDDGSVNNSCTALTFPGTTLRFHPGHYLLGGAGISQTYLDELSSNPDLRGVSVVYEWVDLEAAIGEYDFGQIAADLAAVKSVGKRLMVMIRDKSFAGDPFVPVPAYMRTPEYSGGYVGTDQSGYVAKRWVPAVNARYTALISALGAAFAADPRLEAVKTAESAAAAAASLGAEYSSAAYATELNLRIDALAAAFPSTVTALYLNWLPADTTAMLDAITAHAREHRVAIGGPDIHPDVAIPAYSYYPLYHGVTPIMIEAQWDNVEHVVPLGNTDALLRFATDSLRANYVCWLPRPGFESNVSATVSNPDFADEFPVDPTR